MLPTNLVGPPRQGFIIVSSAIAVARQQADLPQSTGSPFQGINSFVLPEPRHLTCNRSHRRYCGPS